MSDNHDNFHHHVGKVEHIYRKILHILELTIAGVTILVLVAGLCVNIWKIFADPTAFSNTSEFLHTILNIVVGLEFVRMLIDMTPANTLEVLIMATARHIIMNHSDPITLLVSVICVAGLFATRRFLIPRNEMTLDLVELE
ncbi:MAG: hypothetical protein IKJ99_01255 [Oscillospiraceae bacterium]|nr:hypothetical protein [Oscillospiraceae bacterium]